MLGIQDAVGVHGVPAFALEAHHTAHLQERQTRGETVTADHRPDVKSARINHNRWIIDCECGAGVAVDRLLSRARCCYCGGIHRVVMPHEATAIAAVLERRLDPSTRNWSPGETVADLQRENAAHGVPV